MYVMVLQFTREDPPFLTEVSRGAFQGFYVFPSTVSETIPSSRLVTCPFLDSHQARPPGMSFFLAVLYTEWRAEGPLAQKNTLLLMRDRECN